MNRESFEQIILMTPQPLWEEHPVKDDFGDWVGEYGTTIWGGESPEFSIEEYVCTPPSPQHQPVFGDDGKWYWATDPKLVRKEN